MEQRVSPDKGLGRHTEFISKLANLQIVALTIPKSMLPTYLQSALETGFKVEKVANEGEEYPRRYTDEESMKGEYTGRVVLNQRVQGKDFIAIFIERPGDSKDHVPFWDNLKSTEEYKKCILSWYR